MKTFKLAAEPRTDLGKKAAKALRSEGKIPVVLNGGEPFELPFNGTLKPGEKLVEIGNNKAIISIYFCKYFKNFTWILCDS